MPDYDGKFALNWEDRFLLYSTKTGVARLEIPTGEVTWSKELSNLKFKDVDRFGEVDDGALFQIKNNFLLLDPESGEEKWSFPVAPSSKLAKEGIPWFHDLGNRLLIMAKDGPTLIDPVAGTVLYSVEDKYNKKIDEPVISLGDKALFFFDKRLRVVDLDSGKETFAIEGKVEETTSLKAIDVGGKTYIFFGFNKQLIAFDGATGQKVWETAEGTVEGSVRWVGSAPGSDNVLIVTLRSDKFGKDAGTWLKMYSLNAATGDVAWSQMIGYSQGASVFVNKAFNAVADGRGGYEISIWFEGPYADGDNLIFLMKGMATGDSVTLERTPSEGLISINGNTGEVNYQAKFPIMPKKPGKGYAILGVGPLNDLNDAYPSPIETGNTILAADASGSIKWSNTDFKVDPTLAMASHVGTDSVLYGCDGESLYVLSLDDGKFKWQFDIEKDGKAGKIAGDKAWAVKVEKSSFTMLGSTTTWSDPRRILRAENRGSHFIVFGDKAIIRVDKDGSLAWTHQWKCDNDQKNLHFDPTFVGANDDIVYACKGFYGIDGKTGEVKWADKDVVGEFYLVTDDLLVVEHKDKVRGYSLT